MQVIMQVYYASFFKNTFTVSDVISYNKNAKK